MIGYIKKDCYLSRKMIIMAVEIFVFFLVLGLAFRYAYIYGNFKNEPEGSAGSCEIIFTFLVGAIISIMLVGAPLLYFDMDRKSNFNMIALSSSKLEKEIIGAKVIEIIIFTVASILGQVLYGIIFGILFGFSNVKYGIWLGIITVFLNGIIFEMAFPLTIILKKADSAVSAVVIGLFICFMGISFYAVKHPNDFFNKIGSFFQGKDVTISYLLSRYGLMVMLVVVMVYVLGLLVAYTFAIKAFSRREKVCGV